jgi:hypothetical protein
VNIILLKTLTPVIFHGLWLVYNKLARFLSRPQRLLSSPALYKKKACLSGRREKFIEGKIATVIHRRCIHPPHSEAKHVADQAYCLPAALAGLDACLEKGKKIKLPAVPIDQPCQPANGAEF